MAFVVRDRSLPWLVVIGGLSNLGLTGYGALLVLYLVRDLGLTTDMVGWYFTTGAIGGVIGSVIAVPLARRIGSGRLHTAALLACRSRGCWPAGSAAPSACAPRSSRWPACTWWRAGWSSRAPSSGSVSCRPVSGRRSDMLAPMSAWTPPELPVSAGAILLDEQGRLLILKPTYKSGWTIPGGVMEADGESPWDACRREVREETGLEVDAGRLVVVDTRPGKDGAKLGLRLLFHCGTVTTRAAQHIRLQQEEISEHRFAPVDEALQLLRKPVRRRVAVGLEAEHATYLENGRPAPGIR